MRKEKELYSEKETKNKLIMLWFYLGAGVEQLINRFKYYYGIFISILAFFDIEHKIYIFYLAIGCIPVFILFGWIWVRFMAKKLEYYERQKTTYWAMHQINLQEKTNQLLEEIKNKLNV